jgi:hypothetical protein
MCFLRKDNTMTGKHHKPATPKRVKVVLHDGSKRTKAQKKYDKRADKRRRAALAAVTRQNELLRQKEIEAERKVRKQLKKNKNA